MVEKTAAEDVPTYLDLSTPAPDAMRGGVVAIGNFDGVHRGHQAVLSHALEIGRAQGVPVYALSFEPHPRTLFKPESPVFRLTPAPLKARIVKAFGLDGLFILPFTKDLAATSAQDFIDTHLLAAAGASHVVTGFNFMFGAKRQGTPEFLTQAGAETGFGVTIIEEYLDQNGEEMSSSRIRRMLGEGDVTNAARLLGYRWCVSGAVQEGAKLGRTLGYPTANLALEENCHLAHGIYAVRLRRADGRLHHGVSSYGRRPTFDNGAPLLETFVFDFNEDLYGEAIEVTLFEFLRGEEKFESAEALIAQMDRDSSAARNVLQSAKPHSSLDEAIAFSGMVA